MPKEDTVAKSLPHVACEHYTMEMLEIVEEQTDWENSWCHGLPRRWLPDYDQHMMMDDFVDVFLSEIMKALTNKLPKSVMESRQTTHRPANEKLTNALAKKGNVNLLEIRACSPSENEWSNTAGLSASMTTNKPPRSWAERVPHELF